jgi:hypothetical protein
MLDAAKTAVLCASLLAGVFGFLVLRRITGQQVQPDSQISKEPSH